MLTIKAKAGESLLKIKDVGVYNFKDDVFHPSHLVKEVAFEWGCETDEWAPAPKNITNPVLVRMELENRQWLQSIQVFRKDGVIQKVRWSRDGAGSSADYFDIHFENGKPDRGDDSVGSDCLNRLTLP